VSLVWKKEWEENLRSRKLNQIYFVMIGGGIDYV
jgi:hypothetical protein